MSKNTHSVMVTIGASNHSSSERPEHDYFATEPKATEEFLKLESFSNNVWECACGQGHISEVLKKNGYNVKSTDIVDRGYGDGCVDFLQFGGKFDGDIITNPPYSMAYEFVEHALDCIKDGHRVAMFLKIQFLEGKKRRKLHEKYPPHYIYVSSGRLSCLRNGDFSKENKENCSAQAYAWFVWDKGYTGDSIVRWFN